VQVIDLWPEGVPNSIPNAAPEREEAGRIYNVSVPSLSVYPAAPALAKGMAAIVCPGGAYARLAVAKEGVGLTRWLNRLGVTVFLLKYRTAPFHHPAQLQDVLRAMRLVRKDAAKWAVDPHRLGIFGASAGGHLAAAAGTLFDSDEGKTGAILDQVSARPDFLVLMYPVITMKEPYVHVGSRQSLLGDNPTEVQINAQSLELHVRGDTPPAFMVHSQEDRSVPVDNSILFYQALRSAGVSVEMHLYELGPHGFGLQPGLGATSEWPHRCEEWMHAHGWM
jgi:acetyl esterase/lipase